MKQLTGAAFVRIHSETIFTALRREGGNWRFKVDGAIISTRQFAKHLVHAWELARTPRGSRAPSVDTVVGAIRNELLNRGLTARPGTSEDQKELPRTRKCITFDVEGRTFRVMAVAKGTELCVHVDEKITTVTPITTEDCGA